MFTHRAHQESPQSQTDTTESSDTTNRMVVADDFAPSGVDVSSAVEPAIHSEVREGSSLQWPGAIGAVKLTTLGKSKWSGNILKCGRKASAANLKL